MKRSIEVEVRGKSAERHELVTALAWVGSSGGGLLLPLGTVAPDIVQLTFSPVEDGVRVEIPEGSARWFVCEGSQMKRMLVRRDSEIYFDHMRFAFLEEATASKSKGLLVIALGVLLIVLGALALRLSLPIAPLSARSNRRSSVRRNPHVPSRIREREIFSTANAKVLTPSGPGRCAGSANEKPRATHRRARERASRAISALGRARCFRRRKGSP